MRKSSKSNVQSLFAPKPEELLQELSAEKGELATEEVPGFWTFVDPDTGEKTDLRPHMFKPGEQVFNSSGELIWTAPLDSNLVQAEELKMLSYDELRLSDASLPLVHKAIVRVNLFEFSIGGMSEEDPELA